MQLAWQKKKLCVVAWALRCAITIDLISNQSICSLFWQIGKYKKFSVFLCYRFFGLAMFTINRNLSDTHKFASVANYTTSKRDFYCKKPSRFNWISIFILLLFILTLDGKARNIQKWRFVYNLHRSGTTIYTIIDSYRLCYYILTSIQMMHWTHWISRLTIDSIDSLGLFNYSNESIFFVHLQCHGVWNNAFKMCRNS